MDEMVKKFTAAMESLQLAKTSPRIKPFSGDGTQNVDEWLLVYEAVVVDSSRRFDLVSHLEGKALVWYATNVNTWETLQYKWAEVKGEMKKEYAENKTAVMVQLMHITQGDKSVTDFVSEVLCLCSRVDNTMSNETKLLYIMKGLNSNYKDKLILMKCDSPADLITNYKVLEANGMFQDSTPAASASAFNAEESDYEKILKRLERLEREKSSVSFWKKSPASTTVRKIRRHMSLLQKVWSSSSRLLCEKARR